MKTFTDRYEDAIYSDVFECSKWHFFKRRIVGNGALRIGESARYGAWLVWRAKTNVYVVFYDGEQVNGAGHAMNGRRADYWYSVEELWQWLTNHANATEAA